MGFLGGGRGSERGRVRSLDTLGTRAGGTLESGRESAYTTVFRKKVNMSNAAVGPWHFLPQGRGVEAQIDRSIRSADTG